MYDQLAPHATQMYAHIMAALPAQDVPLLLEALKVCTIVVQPLLCLPKVYAHVEIQ